MSPRAQWAELRVEGSQSILGFENDPPTAAHLRYLTLEGKRAYEVGITCETCAFLFQRLGHANQKVSPTRVGEALRNGIADLEDELVDTVAELLPDGLTGSG